jgi:gliding motility-associated-like protein
MKSHFFLFLLFISSAKAQNLIINEVSQGPSGSKEYVEFLVVPGTGPYQCSDYCLDLRGWIIDDNNGYFSGGGGSGLGIAAGAVRFSTNSFWSCVRVGTLILVYNDQDLNSALPPIDNSLTDGNCTVVLPISSNLFEHQTVSPTTSIGTYPTTGWSPGGLWGPISMANGGDSFQIYNATNLTMPVHGVSWVNNNVNPIIFFSTTASNAVYFFANILDNNPSNQANWVAGTCSAPDNQTPGSPNNTANASYIQSLTNNCAGPLTATLSSSTDAGNCQCNGTATVSATGSIPGYSYQWYDATNTLIGQNSATASNLCAGNYYCVVTSSINCTDTVLVTINSTSATITPIFTQIPPICSGGSFTLPTTSTNSITGTWSPALNNSATTTYTFTPNSGQCATSTTMTVTVNSQTTPTFTQVAPICSGGSFTLPTTSTNSITGTWSPALNNSATTTYTFTPNSGQCASTTTMTVVVSNGFSPTFNQVAAICEGGSFLLPTASNEGVTGSWSPAINNLQTTSYTFTPDPGQCAISSEMTVIVSPLITPTFNQLGPFCQGVTAPSLSNSSLEGITGVWGPPGINTGAVGTFNYVFVSNPGQCSNNQTMTITVNPSTVPTFSSYGPFCEDAVLAQVLLPETSNNGISGTWNPAMLSTETAGIISYSFTPDPGQCAEVFTLNVEVFAAPSIDAGNNLTICAGSSVQLNASGGIQYSWTSGIQNSQPFQPTQSQVYYVTGTDANGCEATDSVLVTLVPVPTAQFSSDVNSGIAPLTVNFTNTSSNATSYDWNFGDGNEVITFDLSNVSNSFNNPGAYAVWLVATNGFCSDSISTLINVNEAGQPILIVPNVLTPNGDGTNDEWFISTQNISELEVIIVNRWGNEITKIQDVTGTWDGKTPGGDEATDGTYFYKYQAKGLNGVELSGHGFITLIR